MTATHDHFAVVTRDNLGLGHVVVEVGVLGLVASGVHTICDVDGVVLHALHIITDEPAIALLCGNTLDLGTLCLDVVGDRVHVQRGFTLREQRAGRDDLSINRVGLAVGVNALIVEVDIHVIGLQVHVVVCDITLLVDIDAIVAQVVEE